MSPSDSTAENRGNPPFWKDLLDRGILFQQTSDQLGRWIEREVAAERPVLAYAGFDPTASSLHVGSLLPILGLRRLKAAGVKPIAVVGGATGMIGDPSGKSEERTLLSADDIAQNVIGIGQQLERLLDGDAGKDFLLVNNADWFRQVHFIDFLRDVGKHFSVNNMMAKDSVRSRLEDRDQGISYTEFSYMLVQAYDYLHLYETVGCRLQCGGSDQWGNITAGIDLIKHKHHGAEVHGATFPLLLTSSGQKFGKSERGAIFLDPGRTHPYFCYRYFFDTPDADVVRFLKLFTFLPLEEIESIEGELTSAPERRTGPRRLAREITGLIHSPAIASACEGLEQAMHTDDVDAFEQHAGALGLLDPESFPDDVDPKSLPVVHRTSSDWEGEGISVIDLAVQVGLFKSNSEVRREMPSGALRLAGEPITDVAARVTKELIGSRKVVPIRRGKKQKRMLIYP